MIWLWTTIVLWFIGAVALFEYFRSYEESDDLLENILYSVFWFIAIPVVLVISWFLNQEED
jgi:hypothetical protein